jgi:tetratricopeptide (TPR) repeat protein
MSIDKAKALKNAQRYTQKGQYDKAVTEYLKLIETDPGEKTYKNFLGDLYLKQGNQESAIRAFLEAAAVYQTEGFTPHTIALYKKILRIDPNRMELYLDLGKLYAEQGLVGDAITNFKIAADHYFSRGQKQHALKTYKNIVDLDPKNLNVKLRLGELYAREGMRPEAAAQYAGVAEKLAAGGKTTEAFTYYTKARELQPDNPDAIKGLIGVCMSQDKTQEAIGLMEALRVLEPSNVQNLLLLGKSYVKLGRRDASIETFEKVVSADPAQMQAHETLSRLYLERGDRTRAWNTLMPVIDTALNQNDRQTAGRLLEEFAAQLGNEKGFLQKQYEHAVLLNDTNKRLSYGRRLAAQLEGSDAPDRALEIYQELAYLAPQDREIAERVQELAATVEPTRAALGGKALEIDLEQIDLSDLQEFGDVQVTGASDNELPLELDFGATPRAIPAVTSQPAAGRAEPKPGPPASKPQELVDVDLSGLDLGEGFGIESEPPEPPRPPVQEPARTQAEAPGRTAPLPRTSATPPSSAKASAAGLDLGGMPLSELDFGLGAEAPSSAPPKATPPAPSKAKGGRFDLGALPLSELDLGLGPAAPEPAAAKATPPVPSKAKGGGFDLGALPLSEFDLGLDGYADSDLDVELELPIAPPPSSKASGKPPGSVVRTPPPERPKAQVLEELSASVDFGDLGGSVDDMIGELQLGDTLELSERPPTRTGGPQALMSDAGPPSRPQADAASAMAAGAAGRDSAARRAGRSKSLTALDRLDRLATPEKPKPGERAKTPESLKLQEIARASEMSRAPEPLARDSERRRGPGAVIALPPEPARPAAPEPVLGFAADSFVEMPGLEPSRTSSKPRGFERPEVATPPAPSRKETPSGRGSESLDMLDISTDFFTPKEPEENPGLIDLGDLILGDQPVVADDEENVNELLRQLREGIEAQVSKEDYDTHYNLGIAYKEMGLLDEAVDEFRRAAGDKTRRVSCLSNIGLCYVQKGLPDQAVVEFRKGLGDQACTDEDRVGLSYELGLVYEQLGEAGKAVDAFRIAARIDPSFRDVQDKLRAAGGNTDGNAPEDRVSFL